MGLAAGALASTGLFGHLDEALAEAVAQAATALTCRRGQMLFFQGDLDDSAFLLLNGLIRLFVISPTGEEMTLVTLKPPASFGELAAIDGEPRSACAQALEPSTLAVLSRARFLSLLQQHPQLMERLLGSMATLARRSTGQIADLVFLDLHGRIAKLLLSLACPDGQEGEPTLDLNMTQSDLARMVGASRQSMNQILHEFEGRGYLEIKGRRIILSRPDRLRIRAGL